MLETSRFTVGGFDVLDFRDRFTVLWTTAGAGWAATGSEATVGFAPP